MKKLIAGWVKRREAFNPTHTQSNLAKKKLTDALLEAIADVQGKIFIGYSGGIDSHTLLHILTTLQTSHPLIAVHIHHGLHQNADDWAIHCQKICKHLKIPCLIRYIQLKQKAGESIEALARKARYQVFESLLHTDDILLTAHHQDDQAETCLMQFLRGSGPKGLAAMPRITKFGSGRLIRPFLSISRQEITDYATARKLHWIDDDSNHDTRFTRNFLRGRVMPLLKDRWPTIGKTIMRVAENAAEADQLLKELAEKDLPFVIGDIKETLSVSKLRQLSPIRQKNVLREWIHLQGFMLPQAIKLQHLLTDLIHAKSDATPCIHWENVEIRRHQDLLYAMPPLPFHDSQQIFIWKNSRPFIIPNIATLKRIPAKGQGLRITENQSLEIRFRQGGEKCRLPGQTIHHSLKNLFQRWKIPAWQRDRIPLIFIDNKFAAVVGCTVCEPFAAKDNEEGWMIETVLV